MSAKQRRKNRATAKDLHRTIINNSVCPECGERGAHWAPVPVSLEDLFGLLDKPQGIWLCDKFYGPDGRRIETRTSTDSEDLAMVWPTVGLLQP